MSSIESYRQAAKAKQEKAYAAADASYESDMRAIELISGLAPKSRRPLGTGGHYRTGMTNRVMTAIRATSGEFSSREIIDQLDAGRTPTAYIAIRRMLRSGEIELLHKGGAGLGPSRFRLSTLARVGSNGEHSDLVSVVGK